VRKDKEVGVTTAVTKTIEARSNTATASAEIVNGRFTEGRLILETRHAHGSNTLYVRSTSHLRDIVQATQELLLALEKETT
jgi:hypothetical protein